MCAGNSHQCQFIPALTAAMSCEWLMTCRSFLMQASFDQGRSILVSHIVRLCPNQITHDDASAAYELVARQGVWLTATIACMLMQWVQAV